MTLIFAGALIRSTTFACQMGCRPCHYRIFWGLVAVFCNAWFLWFRRPEVCVYCLHTHAAATHFPPGRAKWAKPPWCFYQLVCFGLRSVDDRDSTTPVVNHCPRSCSGSPGFIEDCGCRVCCSFTIAYHSKRPILTATSPQYRLNQCGDHPSAEIR